MAADQIDHVGRVGLPRLIGIRHQCSAEAQVLDERACWSAAHGVDDEVEFGSAKRLSQIGFEIVICDDDPVSTPAAD